MVTKKNDIHPIDAYVGEMLRQGRKLRGLSQDALGKEIPEKVTFQQVQKYERGTNRISASRLYEFARLLRLPLDYFFPADDELPPLPLVNNGEATLLDNFRKLPARTQQTITALIATMAGG